MEPEPTNQFRLPINVVTQSDVSRLINDLDKVDNFFLQVQVRRAGSNITLPKTSPVMENVLKQNNLNLLQPSDREKLKFNLINIRTKSPIIHMSFSVSPNQAVLEKIISWMRQNINPNLILQVGVQPSIGAGFTLRTDNKFFDFSMRQYLDEKRDILVQRLKKAGVL